MTKNELNERIGKIEKLMDEYHIWADYEGSSLGTLFDVVKFRIERGDWKHDHWAFDSIVEESFDDVYKIVESNIYSDGSDTYDSTHMIYFATDANKETLDSISVLFR